MLFRTRERATFGRRLRLWLWPRVSWRRSGRYYLKRVLRLSGSPYAIATGSAVGAFAACTPFFGLHFILALALAWVLRGNLVAAAIGTMLGNPLTYPFLWAGSYKLGQALLGEDGGPAPPRLSHNLFNGSWDQLWPVIEPMTLGSVPIGLCAACVVYVVVYNAVAAYRAARRIRLAERRRVASGDPAAARAAGARRGST